LRDVPGDRIGEALAEVDDYCTDSDQTPDEAFGDPVAYAQSLIDVHAPTPAPDSARRMVRGAAQVFATTAGVFALLNGIAGLVDGGSAEVTAGQLASVVLSTAVFPLVLMVVFHPGLRARSLVWGAIIGLSFLTPALPAALWQTPVAHVSAWVLTTGGLFLLAATWWPTASNRILPDRIIDPRTGAEPFTTPRWLLASVRWLLPAVLLFAVLLVVLNP